MTPKSATNVVNTATVLVKIHPVDVLGCAPAPARGGGSSEEGTPISIDSCLDAPARLRSRLLVVLVGLAGLVSPIPLAAPSAVAATPAPVRQPTSATVTADSLPTAQINGVVFAQVVVGDRVFAGGDFTSVRPAGAPAGTGEQARSNLMSYDVTTGKATAFGPHVNGAVKVLLLSADHTTLYVGGQFTLVNGLRRNRVAAFSVATGALTPLAPNVNSTVSALATIGHVLYLGGSFNQVDGHTRTRLAAYDATANALTGWAPAADATVRALVTSPDQASVVAAGNFGVLGGRTAHGMGSLDATTGAARAWEATTVIKDYGDHAAILSLSVDRDTVYGGGYTYGSGNFEGVFAADPATGRLRWLQDCHGDTYSVAAVGEQVYSVSHTHFCSNIGGFPDTAPRTLWHRALAVTRQRTGTVATNTQLGLPYGDFAGQGAPSLYNWFPDLSIGSYTGLSQAAWSVAGDPRYLVLGGEFPEVNGRAQQGLARFAVPAIAPNRQGPRISGAATDPAVRLDAPASVSLTWRANWDRDDQDLSYDVLRNGAVLQTFTATSQFWNRPTYSFLDRTGSPGSSYRYRIRARDPHGNAATGPGVVVIYPSDQAYASRIRADDATHQWRLGGPPGAASEPDTASDAALGTGSGVSFGAPGAIAADANTAATFDGTAAATALTEPVSQGAGATSVEAWVRTASTTGGALVGFGAADRSAPTVAGDRVLSLDATGRVSFAAHATDATSPVTLTSPGSVTDGTWHQVVGVQSADGLGIYVDGRRVAAVASPLAMPAVTGTWSLGGATPADLPGAAAGSFTGTLDDVATFGQPLTADQVRDHYRRGRPQFHIVAVTTGRRR